MGGILGRQSLERLERGLDLSEPSTSAFRSEPTSSRVPLKRRRAAPTIALSPE